MRNTLLLLSFIFCGLYLQARQPLPQTDGHRSVVEVKVPAEYTKEYLEFEIFPQSKVLGIRSKGDSMYCKVVNGIARLLLHDISEFTYIRSALVSGVVEPADSIRVDLSGRKVMYSGKGIEKFQFEQDFQQAISTFDKKNEAVSKNVRFNTYAEYLQRIDYINRKDSLISKIFTDYNGKISSAALFKFRAGKLAALEEQRLRAFDNLSDKAAENRMSAGRICEIFDSISNAPNSVWLRNVSGKVSVVYYYYRYVRHLLERKYLFKVKEYPLNDEAQRKIEYFNLAQKTYQGHVLETYLAYLMTEALFKELGFQRPVTKTLMHEYYRLPGYPEYRAYVKNREMHYRAAHVGKDEWAPDFHLSDLDGKKYEASSLRGKLTLICFLPSQLKDHYKLVEGLNSLIKRFSSDSSIVFVLIASKETWASAMKKEFRGIANAVNCLELYSPNESDAKEAFNVTQLPAFALVDYTGRIIENPMADPIADNFTSLVNKIEPRIELLKARYTAIHYDGPYIFHHSDSSTVIRIVQSMVDSNDFVTRIAPSLHIATDIRDKFFSVQLKKKHVVEPAHFDRPGKLLVLSDIEGNFTAFKKLLQANRVMDQHFNWTFGKGHLVFAGDMFDRGEQVTECLWLIYSLEEKARQAGGYVHFVLGNHEIMNLSGNAHYVQPKYKDNAARMGLPYSRLFDEHTELGRWLRTKNIMLRIGDLLFLHGGVSPQVNRLPLTLNALNEKARPFYAMSDSAVNNTDTALKTLYHYYESPFWYRHYYKADHFSSTYNRWVYKASQQQIDSTLQKFNVKHIITGHSIVADTISVHYGGKVINTDVHHARGISEALLIEDSKFYRVNARGDKTLLFDDQIK